MPIVNGLPSIIKSVQHRTINFSSGTSKTDTVTTVNVNKTIIVHTGQSIVGPQNARLVLTNATTVTCTLSAAGLGDVSYDLVEFY